ncbi:DUF2249 domain-containing protein [Evansella sp. AB-P1]|uniref:DUF2249 domain-containing protein n=1 Tax=Evansella sp. AB-P1 TaxID=3037653 RepID=UPI00241CE3F2|nr:DUF2249 domain-containing protein [Evansella sp. AB-P1]MDG5789172.1 DUF2249 domain-containing protein [Evansella sp. AB-P1]
MSKEIILDVRNDLNNKRDPFKKIMTTVKSLKKDEIFILHSTIKPTPLLTIMKAKGFEGKVKKIGTKHYETTFIKRKGRIFSFFSKNKKDMESTKKDNPLKKEETTAYFLDNRGLEPPQPMVRTMKRLETLQSSETLTIHNDRVPVYLLEELKDVNIQYSVENLPDGTAKVHLTKI